MHRTLFVDHSSVLEYATLWGVSPEMILRLGFLLDKNATEKFPPNATLSDILGLLLIEDWNDKINYDLYYKNCNPINCFYTITKKFHIPTVLTSVIGLMGGISVILKIILPPIVKLIRYRWRLHKENTRIVWQGKEQIERSILNEK